MMEPFLRPNWRHMALAVGVASALALAAPTAVLGQNLALWRAHPVEFQVLEATGFYTTP